jgi:cholesterol oxidase
VRPTRGPTITAAVDFLDGSHGGQRFFIEDGGFPDLAGNYLKGLASSTSEDPWVKGLINTLRFLVSGSDPFRHVMPWFAQGRDAANGTLSLKLNRLFLEWDARESAPTIEAIVEGHRRFARATGGLPMAPLTWTVGRDLITPHPLGGCNMGTSPDRGVVSHAGEVFGYRNLYVADGAIVPEALGLNPSKTIAALAERIAALIVAERR